MTASPERIGRTAEGRIEVRLAGQERELLGALAAGLAAETADGAASVSRSGDPGLARLWPDAVADDDRASAAFRELAGRGLEDARQARFATLAATIGAASLSEAEATAWLGAINDLRLVHGTRLGVAEEVGRDPIDEDDPAAGATIVFLWLGWVEEQLVEALAAGLPEVD